MRHRRRGEIDGLARRPRSGQPIMKCAQKVCALRCVFITPLGMPVVPPVARQHRRRRPGRIATLGSRRRLVRRPSACSDGAPGSPAVAVDADPQPDLGQPRPQLGDHRRELLLEEQHLAVEGIEHVVVLLGRIARADRNPAHVRAPQAQRAGPRHARRWSPRRRPWSPWPKPAASSAVGDAAGQLADLVEACSCGRPGCRRRLRIDAPAAVEEVDDGHGGLRSRSERRRDGGARQAALLEEAEQVAVAEGLAGRREADLVGLAVEQLDRRRPSAARRWRCTA